MNGPRSGETRREIHPSLADTVSGGVRQSRPHDSAVKHVTGRAIYVDDIPEPPGTLQVYIAQSTRAHAKLVTLGLDDVRAAPGVIAVMSAADIPGDNDLSPTSTHDDPLFATDRVQYVGQAIFAVAADTMAQARAAALRAVVTYEDRPAILTISQALAARHYLEPPYVMQRGDVDGAMRTAPRTLVGRIDLGGQEHFYLEGHAALAIPGEDRDMTIHASSQHPSEIQHKVAGVLGVASHAVTVEVRRMGGGFGGKESQGNLPAAVAALGAHLTRRPAKCVYDRDDDFMITGKRHDMRIDYRVGFDDQGRILGLDVSQAVRCGMSFDLSQPIADRAMFHADNCYYLPTARITSYRLKTHTQSNTAFRGFGGPQGMVAMERIIDEIAHTLHIDPLEVRRRNFYAHKNDPASERRVTPYHMTVEDCVIQDIVDELAVSSDYAKRRAEIEAWNASSPILKRGIALTPVKFGIAFTKTFLNQAGALVHIYSDGSIALNHGGTEMGQGLFVKVAQVVAETFQVDLERVKITATHTGKVPNTSATAASSGADLNAMAARNAAETIKQRLIGFLMSRHGVTADAINFKLNCIHVAGQTLAFNDVIRDAYMARISLSATGFYATPKVHWDRDAARGRPFYYFSYGAAVSEVAMDTLTGENRILRVDILHDVGRSLNPAIDLGQIEGGFVQGAGWLTTEELVWDAQGRLLTHAPSTYKIPVASDRAPDMRVQLFQRGENIEDTIYKSKAVGEPPLMLSISVLLALSHAVAACGPGYPSLDTPATPERVLVAVERMQKATAS
jgi:xanthine dehydrogenase large subunit